MTKCILLSFFTGHHPLWARARNESLSRVLQCCRGLGKNSNFVILRDVLLAWSLLPTIFLTFCEDNSDRIIFPPTWFFFKQIAYRNCFGKPPVRIYIDRSLHVYSQTVCSSAYFSTNPFSKSTILWHCVICYILHFIIDFFN